MARSQWPGDGVGRGNGAGSARTQFKSGMPSGNPHGRPRKPKRPPNRSLKEAVLRGGRVGLHRDRQRISGSSAGCFLELPIWGVMQGGRSPTGVMPHIGGQIHAAIASGSLSKYV